MPARYRKRVKLASRQREADLTLCAGRLWRSSVLPDWEPVRAGGNSELGDWLWPPQAARGLRPSGQIHGLDRQCDWWVDGLVGRVCKGVSSGRKW